MKLKKREFFSRFLKTKLNGHNYIQLQLDKKGISYKMKGNAFTQVADPDGLNQIAQEIDGKLVQERINFWMNRFFRFDKGTYSTRSKHLNHDLVPEPGRSLLQYDF